MRLCRIIFSLFMPASDKGGICPTLYGFEILLNQLDKGIERVIYYHGVYEAGTLYVLKECLREGDVFLDVGANIGFISLAAASFVGTSGKVYSFEPLPETFEMLRTNLSINNITNVGIYNIALGSTKESMPIYDNDKFGRGSASLMRLNGAQNNGREISVDTLDAFISCAKVNNIRMLKIDVEGYELEVLEGAKKLLSHSNAPIICIEYSNIHPIKGGKPLDIYRFIKRVNDYQVYKLRRGKSIPSKLVRIERADELPYHDNLFCFLRRHLEEFRHLWLR